MRAEPRNVLIIAYHFFPSNASGAARPYRFYKYLREFGYRPHVIARGEDEPSKLQDVYYVPNPIRAPKQIAPLPLAERTLRRLFFPVDEGVLWTLSAVRRAKQLLSTIHCAALFSTNPPVNTLLAGLLLRRKGVKWIADFRDPLRDDPFRPNGLPAKAGATIESMVFERADLLITVTDPIADGWRRRYPQWAHKMEVIYNGFDPEEEFPAAVHSPHLRRVLAHIGRSFGARTPVVILRSLQRLIGRGILDARTVLLQLIGGMDKEIYSANRPLFTALKEKGCLEWTTDDVPRVEAKAAAVAADYLLLLDQNAGNLAYALPAKLFDYVRAARPMLLVTQHGSPLDLLLPESGIPHIMIYSDDSEEQIDRQLAALFLLPREPAPARTSFLTKFDGRKHAERLAELLDRLIADR